MAAVDLPDKFSGDNHDLMDAESFIAQIKYATWGANQMFPDVNGQPNPEITVYRAYQLANNTVGSAKQFVYTLDRATRRNFEKLSETLISHFPVADVSARRMTALQDMLSLSQGTATVVTYVAQCRDVERRLTLLAPEGNYSSDMVTAMIDGLKDVQVKMLTRGLLVNSKTYQDFEAAASLLEQMVPGDRL